MVKTVSQSEFARQIGVSPGYINKLVKTGVLKLQDGKINSVQGKKDLKAFASQLHETPGPKGKNEPGDDSLASWRKRELAVKVHLKKLQYDEERGLLVNKDELLFSLKDLFLGIRGQILSIPTKMIGEMTQIIEKGCNVKVPLAVQSQLSAMLRKEVLEILTALSTWDGPGATTKQKKGR